MAFFSGTDLKDEAGSRLFGVIGKVNTDNPECVFRAASNRQAVDLKIADIFDYDVEKLQDDSDYSIDTNEQLTKISEIVSKIVTKSATGNRYIAGQNVNQYGSYGKDDYDDYNYGYGGYGNYGYGNKSKENNRKAVEKSRLNYNTSLYYTGENTNAFAYFAEKFRDFLRLYSQYTPTRTGTAQDQATIVQPFYALAALVFEEMNYKADAGEFTKADIENMINDITSELELAADDYLDCMKEDSFDFGNELLLLDNLSSEDNPDLDHEPGELPLLGPDGNPLQ